MSQKKEVTITFIPIANEADAKEALKDLASTVAVLQNPDLTSSMSPEGEAEDAATFAAALAEFYGRPKL